MQPIDALAQRDLVLIGGGHAHIVALRGLAMRPVKGLRITLISPSSQTPYSGMLPGLIAGEYTFDDICIDLRRLCQWADVRFITDTAIGLDVANKHVLLEARGAVGYDILSIDTGATPELDCVPGAREYAIPVKPVHSFWERWQDLLAALSGNENPSLDVAVVGAGAGGVELTLAMARALQSHAVRLHLFGASDQLLPGYHSRSQKAALHALEAAGVQWHPSSEVKEVHAGKLVMASGVSQRADHIIWCTGAIGPDWLKDSGLPLNDRDFLLLENTLQVTGHEGIFAAGDVGTQTHHPRPKAGVYAVRQGPILADNLRRYVLDKPLRKHRPQQRFLSLLTLDNHRAVADRGWWSAHGRWAKRWKRYIDRQFMRRFSELPYPMARRYWGTLKELQETDTQQPCGGCGAKIGPLSLHQVLSELRIAYPETLSTASADDASEIPTTHGAGNLWQSIDALRAIVDDPWLMGRLCAIHALSDLYACGLKPHSAQALISLPFAADRLLTRDLGQFMHGLVKELAQAECKLLGGHSMQGAEMTAALSVNGEAVANMTFSKTSVQAGDDLIITGPLGTGALFAANMQLQARGCDIDATLDHMLQSNRKAADIAREHAAHAITDITGFGLAGHLLEMLGDDFTAKLRVSDIPTIDGAKMALDAGITSTGHINNAHALGAAQNDSNTALLCDPQTSGPLLLACDSATTPALINDLHNAGYLSASPIGTLCDRSPSNGSSPIVIA